MKAIVVSLKFNPGHVSHMIASYKQLNELGYETFFYISKKFLEFLPSDFSNKCILWGDETPKDISVAFFLFPSHFNIYEIIRLKIKYKTKIIYVFHEPIDKYKEYILSGYSQFQTIKRRLINFINIITVRMANVVILPSRKALTKYDKNSWYHNKERYYIPLMYDDEVNEVDENVDKCYFSYIGTVTPDHSFNEYVKFVKWAIETNWEPEINFLIATKSNVSINIVSPRIKIVKGRPMTNKEIDSYYNISFAIWNAYDRTTQSGVLPKAFMFGTSAIVLEKNISEYTEPYKDIELVKDNTSILQISSAVLKIFYNRCFYSTNCRNRFLETFYYKIYNDKISEIISKYAI